MAQQTAIKIRRSSVASKIPLTTDLVLGELALNTYDGVLYFKKSPSGTDSIVAVVTLDGTQTLTNKTLTSPALTTPSTTGLASFTTTTTANAVNITYNPTATTGAGLFVTGTNTRGGSGYLDFLSVTNSASGATNPSKTIRIDSAGTLQIINSAYTSNIFNLTEAGELTVPSFVLTGTFKDSTGSVGTNNQILSSTATGTKWITSSSGSSGTVTSVSVVSANGFTGTVANSTTTPAITLTTSINGLLKGNGTAISAATAGTDYIAPYGSTTANYVLAAPNGSAGTPTFRALVAADIPPVTNIAGGTTGAINYQSSANTTTFLTGNSTTTPQFVTSTGTGSAAQAPTLTSSTGTGNVVLATSPSITTSITTGSTSFNLLNTTATTVNAFGAATAISIGASTGTTTVNNNFAVTGAFTGNIIFGTVPTSPNNLYTIAPLNLNNNGASGTVKTQLNLINTAGGGGAGSAIDFYTYLDAGNSVPGSRLSSVDDGSYSANIVFQTKGQTANGALSTKFTIGSTGIVTLTSDIVGIATQNVFNTTSTTVNAFGAATTVSIGASTGTTTINNNVTVTGNLTVNGTTTTLNATTITVDDINIELGSIASPTDTTANGGGITLKGTTDKTIVWDSANTNWTSSENWNLATGKVYKINNVSVLSATGLGTAVVSSSLTSVGTLTSGTWNASVIGPAYGGTGVNNGSNTITVGGNVTYSGAYTQTFTATGNTSVTLPTTGTLATLAGSETLSSKTLASVVLTGTVTAGGGVGTSGQVLSSTGTGVHWIDAGGAATAVSYASQSLSTAQQTQARANINAASPDDAYIYSLIF